MLFSSVAQAQAPKASAQQPSIIETLLPFLFVVLIFYLLLIRPQGKRHKKHVDFLGGLKKGDSVLTSGGILGTIEGITDQFVTLDISDGVRVRVLKTQISSSVNEDKK